MRHNFLLKHKFFSTWPSALTDLLNLTDTPAMLWWANCCHFITEFSTGYLRCWYSMVLIEKEPHFWHQGSLCDRADLMFLKFLRTWHSVLDILHSGAEMGHGGFPYRQGQIIFSKSNVDSAQILRWVFRWDPSVPCHEHRRYFGPETFWRLLPVPWLHTLP